MIKQQVLWRRAAVCTVIAGLALSACSKSNNSNNTGSNGNNNQPSAGFPETAPVQYTDGKPGGTFHVAIVEPTAIDSYNSQESEGSTITKYIYTGLAASDRDGKVTPAVAKDWSTNDDCSVWTFNLKPGTTFHNGEPVTSASFKRGWERAAIQSAASDVAYHMDQIKGFDEINSGKATTMSGVDATDPNKLVVTLSQPSCEFYIRTVHTVFSPVPSTAGAADNKAYNDAPVGNGPFMMDGAWEHEKGVKLKRFDGYTAGPKANLDAIEFTILPSQGAQQAEYDGFKNGQFDWARIPPEQLTSARSTYESKGQWIAKKTSGINYLLVMVTQKPFDNVKARKAVSEAIDRDSIINGVFKGALAPANNFVPAGFKDAYQAGVCTACKYDPADAKKLAQEAGLAPGTEINFQFNTGGGHELWTAAVKKNLEDNLGLKVNISGVPFKDLLKNEQQPGTTGLFRAAWGADYPTPGNFLQPLLSCSAIGTTDATAPATGDNRGRYCNKDFDALLAKAASTKDEKQRNDIYKQAEKLAIGDDLALIPMFAREQFRLCNTDKWKNCDMDFFENAALDKISQK